MPTLILHMAGEEAIVGDVEALPTSTDNSILIKHPRRRDGKDLTIIEASVSVIIIPLWRLNFVEVLPEEEEEEIISFVREK
jgi:hypothetical protein